MTRTPSLSSVSSSTRRMVFWSAIDESSAVGPACSDVPIVLQSSGRTHPEKGGMLLASYTQQLNPLKTPPFGSSLGSTILAALPVLVLFWLLVARRWPAPKAGLAGVLTAVAVAVIVYGMPTQMAGAAFVYGVAVGMLPVGWTVFNAMLLYNVTVETGHFIIVRRSVAGLSADARIQAILIGFSFGAFLEGAAGAGTPVAICGAIIVGLGFDPFLAAVLCLIANTSPVAYGGLGTPLIVLGDVTNLPTAKLSTMAGHQLPLLSVIVPAYMVRCMCSWKQTFEVLPALIVAGGSFALFQFTFATMHDYTPLQLYPLTDIGGGIFSLVITAIFLRYWKPKNEFRYQTLPSSKPDEPPRPVDSPEGTRFAEASLTEEPALTWRNVSLAWAPFGLMALALLLTGFVRQQEESVKASAGPGPVRAGWFATNYRVAVPTLAGNVYRDRDLIEDPENQKPEGALFN